MKKYSFIILSIAILLVMIIGAVIWVQAFRQSIEDYQAPVQGLTSPSQPAILPQSAKVVIVLVSGLGYESSQLLNLPVLEQLGQIGASTIIHSSPPTYSQTAWVTLITGAPADVNGAPPVDQPPEALLPTTVDTIFARARAAQLKTALLGHDEWRYLISADQLEEVFLVDENSPESDQAILQAALPLLKNGAYDLVLIQFTALEFAAKQQGGPSSNNYQLAAATIDSYLGQISRSIDLSNAVLIVLSDHGYISSGGHGGNEVEVTQQPFVMIGKGVIPGSYTDIRQVDIAPTVTTLLGLAPPTSTYGRILFEMFNLNDQSRTTAQLALAQQRATLAQAYLAQVKGAEATLPNYFFNDLERAQTTFTQNNLGGAFQLALLTREVADEQIGETKNGRIRSEQWSRLAIAAFIALSWFLIMWRCRSRHASLIIVATLITIGLYHTLFQLQGYHYSISSLSNYSQLPFDIARRIVVSLLAGGALVLIFLMLVNEGNWLTLLGTGYGFSVLVTYIFALPLLYAFWQNGVTVDWYLPAVEPLFWQIMSLLEVIIAAMVGLLLPWPIMLLNIFVNWVRHNLSDTPPQSETDALPGLRL